MPSPPLPSDAWQRSIPLADHTTLGVGGPARILASCRDLADLRRVLAWAHEEKEEDASREDGTQNDDHGGAPPLVLGGGSNMVVSDAGYPGVVIRFLDTSLRFEDDRDGDGDGVLLRAGAGLSWDRLVAQSVARNLAGIECLSGIPGLVGAAPIQNIGAYGQEVSDTLVAVEVLDRDSGEALTLDAAACAFGYRSSAFKTTWKGRFIVTAVALRLSRHGRGCVRYRDLERHFPPSESAAPSVAAVRSAVLEIRRSKAMVLEPGGSAETTADQRSAGSFFMNPIVPAAIAQDVAGRVALLRGQAEADSMPRYPAGGDTLKLSAAWLIERAGFHRGYCLGAAALSTRHVLALVNRGGATAQDLLTLAGRIRRRVHDAFGVTLQPEPVFVGFRQTVDALLG